MWEEIYLARLPVGWFVWTFDQIEWTLECSVISAMSRRVGALQISIIIIIIKDTGHFRSIGAHLENTGADTEGIGKTNLSSV